MKSRLAKTVALVVAAGFVAHLGVVSASLAGSDEQVAQAKSGGAAPNAKPTEKKPAPPKPRIAVFRLAGRPDRASSRSDVLVRRGRRASRSAS